jgi:predicted nucleic acid-binding Zn ribbon protein
MGEKGHGPILNPGSAGYYFHFVCGKNGSSGKLRVKAGSAEEAMAVAAAAGYVVESYLYSSDHDEDAKAGAAPAAVKKPAAQNNLVDELIKFFEDAVPKKKPKPKPRLNEPKPKPTPRASSVPSVAAAATACPSCGTALKSGAKFCSQCGAKTATAVCASCGAALKAGAKFCSGCGTKTTA